MQHFRQAYKLGLLLSLMLAGPAFAQEAPGETVPGIDPDRVRPYTVTEPAVKTPVAPPGKDLTADEKAQLEKLFEDNALPPSPGAPAPETAPAPSADAPPPRPGSDGEERPDMPVAPGEGEVVIPSHTMPKEEVPTGQAPPAIVPPAEAPTADQAKGPDIYMDMSRVAVLRVLNKQTTRSRLIELSENGHTSIGTLDIALTECWRSPPDAQPASAALVRIAEGETPTSPKKKDVFHGWLFSANPSLNDMEHPVYDVTLVQCK